MSKPGPKPFWDEARDEALGRAVQSGETDASIAARMGVTKRAVEVRRHVIGLHREAPNTTAPRRALRPVGITAPEFSDAWYEQNHASFLAGLRAAAERAGLAAPRRTA